jgi:UDP-N-acetylmuramate-alanine ligase
MSYFQYIGEISKLFTTLAIAGTNGKSTTTAMSIVAAKNIPDIGIGIVGSMVPQLNGTNIYLNQTHRHEIKQLFDRIMFGDFHVDYSLIKKI